MLASAVGRGVRKGIETMWILAKTLVPAYIVVHLIALTPILEWLSDLTGPWLHWIGLPGEAAVPLVLGLVLNLYAAVGAMASLHLTMKEATIIAIFLSMAHALIVETAVTSRIGVPARFALAVRLGLAVVLSFVVHLVWKG